MTYRKQADDLDASGIAITGDGWGPKVASLNADIVAAIKAIANAIDSQNTLIANNRTETANFDLSNVSESDIVRRLVDNPASIRNGTMVQLINGLFEPLVSDTLIFSGGPDLFYTWATIPAHDTGLDSYIGDVETLNTDNAVGIIS